MRLTWLVPLLVGAIPGVARAQSNIWEEHTVVEEPQQKRPPKPRPGPFSKRPLALLLHLGVGTPYGLGGISAAYSFIPHLALEAGVGTNELGPQIAGKLHVRIVPKENTFFFALGYSQGKHVQDESRFKLDLGHSETTYLPRTWSTARWLDLEAGYEHQSERGMVFRAYGGAAQLLNAGAATGDEPPADGGGSSQRIEATSISRMLPYLGVSVGKAF